MIRNGALSIVAGLFGTLVYFTGSAGEAQVVEGQAVDANGAPQYIVDPFWPKPLPNQWSMQQVTGIHVDHMDHIWFINRGRAALPIELAGGTRAGSGAVLRARAGNNRARSGGQRPQCLGRPWISSAVADVPPDRHCRQ